jgi:hypothetical protein
MAGKERGNKLIRKQKGKEDETITFTNNASFSHMQQACEADGYKVLSYETTVTPDDLDFVSTTIMTVERKPYKNQIQSLHVVAVRKGQHEVNAPEHANWGSLKCDSCTDEFCYGPPRMFGVFEEQNQYLQRLRELLVGEHKRQQQHQDNYDLGA